MIFGLTTDVQDFCGYLLVTVDRDDSGSTPGLRSLWKLLLHNPMIFRPLSKKRER